jgi:hypothetical protein
VFCSQRRRVRDDGCFVLEEVRRDFGVKAKVA